MDGSLHNGHIGVVVERGVLIAVGAMNQQGLTVGLVLNGLLDLLVALIEAAHEAHLDQTLASGDLGVDHTTAAGSGGGQRLLTEHVLLLLDGFENKLLMGLMGQGRHHDSVDVRGVNQVLACCIDLGPVQIGHLLSPFRNQIADAGESGTVDSGRKTLGMVGTHGSNTDDSNT